MKKYLLQFLVLIVLITSGLSVKANDVGITIDGNRSTLESSAFISDGRTYVPMRDLFENIGATVSWENETKSATAIFGGSTISFEIGSNIILKDGKVYKSDSDCKLIGGKTYIPLRIILELLGFNVNWNENDENINISTPPGTLPEYNDTQNPENSDKPTNSSNEFELKVLELINIERSKNGLATLSINDNLNYVARMHSQDMHNRNFFSHTNPDGLSPFDRLKKHGISYRYAAENIAAGQSSPDEVVKSWMGSKGHRENILNPNFKKIGIGYYNSEKGYSHYWTQCFTD